jgi:hypothetical protein
VLTSSFVPGLQSVTALQAYEPPPDRPRFRPLRLVENPPREKQSASLLARGGKVPYLYRWTETNRGLSDTVARFIVTGVEGGRTAVPIIANLTTGDMLGYMGTLRFGQTVVFTVPSVPDAQDPRAAVATLDGRDASASVFSMSGFALGVPFTKEQLDSKPRLPRMVRGPNEWISISAGFYGVKGLDHFFFAIADDQLREGAFDDTFFDESVFPFGTVVQLQMNWTETEPASFEVHVPRYITVEPGVSVFQDVADGLSESILELHAAGVRAAVLFDPFIETQPQRVTGRASWVQLDAEAGPAGRDQLTVGARFGDSPLGGSRFD